MMLSSVKLATPILFRSSGELSQPAPQLIFTIDIDPFNVWRLLARFRACDSVSLNMTRLIAHRCPTPWYEVSTDTPSMAGSNARC